MKKLKTYLWLLFLMGTFFTCGGVDAHASTPNSNVSVTVPASVKIVFLENGSNSVSELYVFNTSLVPIEIDNIRVTEFNDWQLVAAGTEILVNQKQLSFQLQNQVLGAGENQVQIAVQDGEEKKLDLSVQRGAFTQSFAPEKALEMEFEYLIGKKTFSVFLNDGDGNTVNEIRAENGDLVILPAVEKDGYEFAGWQDDSGNVYVDEFYMPIGNVKLTALWKKLTTYAVFTEEDGTLVFLTSAEEIKPGDVYNEKRVTTVYTGFETQSYTSCYDVPWYIDGTYQKVQRVVADDIIRPISTGYWFMYFENCMYYDLTHLCMTDAVSMDYMFANAGRQSSALTVIGVENWDVSNVESMNCVFSFFGTNTQDFNIGDLGKWDVSKVTRMIALFQYSGYLASNYYIGDLSNWNTVKVEHMGSMFAYAGTRVSHFFVGNLGKWDVSNVKNMSFMFQHTAQNSQSFYFGEIENWSVENVESFEQMFDTTAEKATNFNLGNLGKWNVSSAKSMFAMFSYAGMYSQTFYIGDLSGWNTVNVTTVGSMFNMAGMNAVWHLNCSSWNVSKVTYYSGFHSYVESKVVPPNWVN